MAITAGAYAWQVHGWVWGLVIAALLYFLVPVVTAPLFHLFFGKSEDPLKFANRLRKFRWAIWLIVMLGIGISGAKFYTGG